MGVDLNRLKIVLAEKKKTSKWLAKQLKKDTATVSNGVQIRLIPSLGTLREIADLLDIEVRELITPSKNVEEPKVVYMIRDSK